MKRNTLIYLILIIIFILAEASVNCGKEGHFSHSSGGGVFSWEALRLRSHEDMQHPYIFMMFETYIDGTSDHYAVKVIDLPTMEADTITINGKQGVLKMDGNSISKPDATAMETIKSAQKTFFTMLTCNAPGNYTGQGTQ